LVVIHDATLDRTTDGTGLVADQTWASLRRRDAGRWFASRFADERLWRLEDLLTWARRRRTLSGEPLRVVVEIKNKPLSYPGIADQVAATIRACRMADRSRVISFDHAAVRRLKTLMPDLPAGILFASPPADLSRRMRWSRADAIFPKHTLVTAALMRLARRSGWFVGTWTVNETGEMRRLIGLGVDAIATDFPDRLAALRS
jgi:glycerophosphoryl diester phosphodiesterase